MTIATTWAAPRKEREAPVAAAYASDLAAFQREVERQRAIAREVRRRDAMPCCEREEDTLP